MSMGMFEGPRAIGKKGESVDLSNAGKARTSLCLIYTLI